MGVAPGGESLGGWGQQSLTLKNPDGCEGELEAAGWGSGLGFWGLGFGV